MVVGLYMCSGPIWSIGSHSPVTRSAGPLATIAEKLQDRRWVREELLVLDSVDVWLPCGRGQAEKPPRSNEKPLSADQCLDSTLPYFTHVKTQVFM
jgi:hypothetical protein